MWRFIAGERRGTEGATKSIERCTFVRNCTKAKENGTAGAEILLGGPLLTLTPRENRVRALLVVTLDTAHKTHALLSPLVGHAARLPTQSLGSVRPIEPGHARRRGSDSARQNRLGTWRLRLCVQGFVIDLLAQAADATRPAGIVSAASGSLSAQANSP